MRNTGAIAWKELRAYFTSPMGYVVAAVFLGITGYFFVSSVSGVLPEATVRGFLNPAAFLMVFIAPVLTMRLLAEEQKMGTLELLMTAPVRDHEVVLGKFFASLVIFLGTLALTVYFVILLFWYGEPDIGPLLSGYLGLILFGAATLAVGVLASSLTSNQIVAAVVSFGALLILVVINPDTVAVTGTAGEIIRHISLQAHLDDFLRGVIDTGHLFYYITFTAAVLFITTRLVESRRWR